MYMQFDRIFNAEKWLFGTEEDTLTTQHTGPAKRED
jgi:hypothetical protein